MPKRRIIWLLIAGAVLVGMLVAVFSNRGREPEYRGKKLSEWVERYGMANTFSLRSPKSEAQAAIRHFGTNAIPYLLNWMAYEQPLWKYKLNSALLRFKPSWMIRDKRQRLSAGAGPALGELGSEATCAIPELIRLANNRKRHTSRVSAVVALGRLGKPALPTLVGILTNQQVRVGDWMPLWSAAARSLGDQAHLDRETARSALPALLERANDPDMQVQAAANYALERVDWSAYRQLYPPFPK
jgi:hypothetical protein